MSKPTIELVRMPTRGDFEAVKDRAGDECECTDEMRLMYAETKASCKPCAARFALNSVVSLSETL